MEFWTAVRVILRRWYVVVACIVIFGLLAVVVVKQIKPSYEAAGRAIVIQTGQPDPHSTQQLSNPFGDAQAFTQDVADFAALQSFADKLEADGGSKVYAVAPSITNSTLLLLTTTASTPQGALASFDAVVRQLDSLVATMQTGFPQSVLYSLQTKAASNQPTELVGSRTKALILLGVVAVLITLALVFLTDSAAAALGRRRAARREPGAASSGATLSVAEDIVDLDDVYDLDDGVPRGKAAGS